MSLQDRSTEEYEEYAREAREARADIIEMTYHADSGHPGSSFSSIDLLVWLYNEVLRIDPKNPGDSNRDRLIFSKGHASPALYSVLARQGFFDDKELSRLRQTNALLQGHASDNIPGVEFSSGSLGQGLSFAIGTALNARLEDSDYRSFVILGDGELQEGNVWEAIMSAAQERLDNLIAVVEYNGAQNDGLVEKTKSLAPLPDKFEAAGWEVRECDGHDFSSIDATFTDVLTKDRECPSAIIADTEKGKGVSFMEEEELGYHSTVLSSDEIVRAFDEMDVTHRLKELEQ